MKENEKEETAELECPALYTLSPEELNQISQSLVKLNDLQKETYLEIPDKILIRSFDDWMPIGYAVSIDDGWYFEAITETEREEKGKP